MIILKYGNAKKLESAKRWKCKCSKCGCKVILDKEGQHVIYIDEDGDKKKQDIDTAIVTDLKEEE